LRIRGLFLNSTLCYHTIRKMADKKQIELKSEKRNVLGRKVKQLRSKGVVPANVFGKKIKSLSIQLNSKDLKTVFQQAGETKVIELTVKGETKKRPVLISNLQTHPLNGDFLHVDFHQVDLKEKVTATVPVELIGESPAVKEKAGILIHLINEVEVEALPTDLPEKLTLDIGGLKTVGDQLAVGDIKVSGEINLLAEKEEIIAKIEAPKEEEPVEAEVEAAEEGGAAETESPSDEKASAEGEAKPASGQEENKDKPQE